MGLIDQIVNVQISATSATPSLPGTDVMALVGYHTHWTDKIRTYFDPDGMLADGFTSGEALYQMALRFASQNPRPQKFKIIRGTTAVAQVLHFKVTDTNTGDVVGLILTDKTGTDRAVQHTNTPGQTAAQIATALAAIVVAGATLVVDGVDNTQVNITINTAGDVWGFKSVTGGDVTDVTPTASPQNDLAAAALVDPDFYGVQGEWFDANNITAIAAWTEANARLHGYTTGDSNNLVAGQGLFSTLKAAGYNRSVGLFSGTTGAYGGVGWMSGRFTADPGSDTWAFKQIAGCPVDVLTASQLSAATPIAGAVANNGNVYVSIANAACTLSGVCASGLFADIQRGIDALSRDMQLRVFTLLLRNPKVPYTRKGIGMIKAEMEASLQAFQNTGFLSSDVGFTPNVQTPDLATVAPTDKTNRVVRGNKWTAVAQGAAQTVLIQGTLNF